MRWLSRSAEETREAARELAEEVAEQGAAIALLGDLGAGKTVFAKGVALGVGVPAALLASPTFTIAHEVPTARGLRLVHADLFRIETPAELEAAGWHDWLAPGVLLLVEWADRLPEELPPDHLEVRLARDPARPEQREIAARARGPASGALLARWRARRAAAGVPLTDCAA
jgi:tRNA threonylcarbamoyl adenosine modification protein YjeE